MCRPCAIDPRVHRTAPKPWRQMRVPHGHLDGGVTHQFLHRGQRNAAHRQVTGERVPQHVPLEGPQAGPFADGRRALPVLPLHRECSRYAQKTSFTLVGGPPAAEGSLPPSDAEAEQVDRIAPHQDHVGGGCIEGRRGGDGAEEDKGRTGKRAAVVIQVGNHFFRAT